MIQDRVLALSEAVTTSPPEPYVRVLSRLASEAPDRIAVTCGAESISRGELERQANRLARAYSELGVGFGDFVTIAMPNSLGWFVSTLACWKLGAVPQPTSYRLPAVERQAIVELADSKLVVGAPAADHPGRPCVPFNYVPDPGLSHAPHAEIVSPAMKAPTSGGSTGRPKLIVAGSEAVGSGGVLNALFGLRSDDVQLVCGPLYHNAPITMALGGLLLGQHVVVLPRFGAETALDAITTYRVTWLQVVPTMMHRMLRALKEEPERHDLSSVRGFWHMASMCPPWLKAAWIELLGPEKVMELYGGTEMQAITVIDGTEWLQHRGSVGRPAMGEMVVLDEAGHRAQVGEVGEIFMRAGADAPATYRYIGAEARTRDGWESLGDLGWMDADGYLYLSDRRTDLIVVGGSNVYPAEIESALESHPSVLSSVVVGIPHEDLGSVPHAIVQAVTTLSERELLDYLSTRVAVNKLPRTVEFVGMPLRDDAGKARRGAIRDAAIARLAASH